MNMWITRSVQGISRAEIPCLLSKHPYSVSGERGERGERPLRAPAHARASNVFHARTHIFSRALVGGIYSSPCTPQITTGEKGEVAALHSAFFCLLTPLRPVGVWS